MRYISFIILLIVGFCTAMVEPAYAQSAPSQKQTKAFKGLHKAAHFADLSALRKLIAQRANLEKRDEAGRTPLHVATFASHENVVRLLAKAGANLNALENQAYDIVTIAAVANDFDMLDLVLDLGASAGNITSPYDGTALIAASHLGHHKVVKRLIDGGAPLDHINNLGWTALIEAVVLGDGGSNHVKTARLLLAAGADKSIADRQGVTPFEHAKSRSYSEMISLFEEFKQ